jgi:hypothetical protein
MSLPAAIQAFHAHLDVCHQCCNNPMALCAKGDMLLQNAAVPPPDPETLAQRLVDFLWPKGEEQRYYD